MNTEHNLSRPNRFQRIAIRLRKKPIVAVVLLLGFIAGPVFAGAVFPEAPLMKQVFGGWIVGAYFALSAVPGHFLEL